MTQTGEKCKIILIVSFFCLKRGFISEMLNNGLNKSPVSERFKIVIIILIH